MKNHGDRREARVEGKQYQETRVRPVRTKSLVKKIKHRVQGEDPQTLTSIAHELKVSRKTVRNVVYNDLMMKTVKSLK